MSSLPHRQTNWLFLCLPSPPLFAFLLSSSLVSVDHPFFSLISSLLFLLIFSRVLLSAPDSLSAPSLFSLTRHISLLFSLLLLSPITHNLSISLSIFASFSSADTLGGGTGCVGGSAGRRSNHRFSIGWSSSWFSSTLWPSPLNITSSLSG